MGRRSYPYFYGAKAFKPTQNHECEACDKRATHWVEYQVSFLRGEDESIKVCGRHFQMARNNEWRKLFGQVETKPQFLAMIAKKQGENPNADPL